MTGSLPLSQALAAAVEMNCGWSMAGMPSFGGLPERMGGVGASDTGLGTPVGCAFKAPLEAAVVAEAHAVRIMVATIVKRIGLIPRVFFLAPFTIHRRS